jgi:hypothetical protein
MCCLKKLIGFLLVLAIFADGGLLYWMKTKSPSGLMAWVETSDADPYYGVDAPDPPYILEPYDRDLIIDMVAESHAFSGVETDFGKITALRNWARSICPEVSGNTNFNDPSDLIEAFESGQGGACGAIGVVYAAALITHGYRARVIQLIRDDNDIFDWTSGPVDTHIEVEVFSPDHQKWIVQDPMFNCWFHKPDSNEPLSARELQLMARNPGMDIRQTGWISMEDAGLIVTEYDGYNTIPRADTYYIDPVLHFRNVFLLYYNIYGKPPSEPVQKYSYLLTARFLGTQKIVRLLVPGEKPSLIYYYNLAANWVPVAIIVFLIILLIPGSKPVIVEDEDDEDEDEDENG